ncbi:hypothetical protein CTEN210_16211 [Chaetoceros tenuissimus]|uniref:Alpha-type protein kinase domain-containing protein n=1 Tax=Chaetoceros tenuissimus TaxID=426638 RepID=A0AAD3HDL4_9STRA|nr:hypothetical protein CTEN210_16211 [Chaetoceros tenuissimus]
MASNTSDTLLPTNSHGDDSPGKPTLGPYDVLDGKGRRAGDGNKYYRSIVRLFKRDKDYINKSDSELKKRIAKAIYDYVTICKGGFFRNENYEVKSEEDSINKITQSLRDYSRVDRRVYNNKDKVDCYFPEIRHIEEKVSKYETIDKQYEVAIEELQNLTAKELTLISHDGSWSGQKRNYEETHTVGVEGQYVPYSRNPFFATLTGYNIHQNLTRSKETKYFEVPLRFHLSNPHSYETFDTFGNWKCDRGTPEELEGDCSGQFSPVEFVLYKKEFSTYNFYKPFSTNRQAPDRHRVVAKRNGHGEMGSEDRDFVKQTCRKRTLVASLAYDFNEFLKKQVPSKTGFPLIVIIPCRIYDGNILVEKKLNDETWKVFTIEEAEVQKKTDEDEDFSLPGLDELLLPGDEFKFFESLHRDVCLPLDLPPAEEADEKCFDLNGQKITFNEIIHLFMAFAFMKTDHQVAIYKVKGSLNSDMNPITYELTDPSIHTSRNHYKSFGDDDEGQQGIEKFAQSIEHYEQLLQKDNQERNIGTSIPIVFEA